MKNPYKTGTSEWCSWKMKNDNRIRNDKLIKDMGRIISENITKITYNEKGYLEVEIQLSDISRYTKEQKEHYIFIEDMTQILYVNTEQFLEWREKRGKSCKTKK